MQYLPLWDEDRGFEPTSLLINQMAVCSMNKPNTLTLSAHVLGQTFTQTITEEELRRAYAQALDSHR